MTNITIPEFLVCPVCKGPLVAGTDERSELVCPSCGLGFEVRAGVPNMIRAMARTLSEAEREAFAKARSTSRNATPRD